MLDCSWCPVCENLIPPERTTISLPPLAQAVNEVEGAQVAAVAAPAAVTTKAGGRGGRAAAAENRRPGVNRQHTKITQATRKATTGTGNNVLTSEQGEAPAPADSQPQQPVGPVRHRIVISQDPTPLYCSEACRLKDAAATNTLQSNAQVLSQPNLKAYGMASKPPFALNNHGSSQQRLYYNHNSNTGASPPSPFTLENNAGRNGSQYMNGSRHHQGTSAAHPSISDSNLRATATTSTTTASSNSVASISPTSANANLPPPNLKMTSTTDSNGIGNGNLISGSAPASTDIDSHPSHALLNGSNGLLPHNVKLDLDKWHNLPTSNSTAAAANPNSQANAPLRNRQNSAYDLYKSTYPLAFETARVGGSRQKNNEAQMKQERNRSGSRHHQGRSSRGFGYDWSMVGGVPDVDVTPTQSLLITKTPARRDDSFDPPSMLRSRPPPSSHGGSDSGSTTSERSESARSESKPPRRKSSRTSSHSKHGSDAGSEARPPRPPELSRSGSYSSRSHGSPSSYRSNSSFLRGGPHPLSSSFSARDIIEQAQERERRGIVKTSEPVGSLPKRNGSAGKENANEWQRRGSGFTAIEEQPTKIPAPTTPARKTEEIQPGSISPSEQQQMLSIKAANTKPAISTSSSSATIVASASPAANRLSYEVNGHPPSPASSTTSGSTMVSKRNSSFANLAGMAASLFGFGGFGGLTMTKTAATPPATEKITETDAPGSSQPTPTAGEKKVLHATNDSQGSTDEPIRGRSRASSRASRSTNEMVATTVNGGAAPTPGSTPASLNLVKGEMAMVPARRPLGPLPKELVEKSRNVSREVREKSEEMAVERRWEKREKRASASTSGDGKLVIEVGIPTGVSGPLTATSTATTSTSAWDPDLVREMKERRKLSHESSYYAQHPSPFHASPATSPTSPIFPSGMRRQRTVSSQSRHSKSSHSRSNSYSQSHRHEDVVQEEAEDDAPRPLPRTESTQSMTSAGSSSKQHHHHHSHHHHHHHHHRESPSPNTTGGSTQPARNLPKGLSMTSLSTYGQPGRQPQPSMYAAPRSPLARTTSQPYVARWMSTSPAQQTFGDTSPTKTGYSVYSYAGSTADAHQQPSAEMQRRDSNTRPPPLPSGPTYPVLNLPVGTRKKKILKTKLLADGTEEQVLTDGEEEEEVFERRKRLFYFDR
ncbi:hypothetical protein FRB94_011915 [Tulasnella sp. JGI-2019a]|nr:hypothetical protein FRB94_011915 [Tulasnella sp. JGI-2019a]